MFPNDKQVKILIFGSKGWIGNKVCNLLEQLGVEFYKSNYRAEDIESIEKEIVESMKCQVAAS